AAPEGVKAFPESLPEARVERQVVHLHAFGVLGSQSAVEECPLVVVHRRRLSGPTENVPSELHHVVAAAAFFGSWAELVGKLAWIGLPAFAVMGAARGYELTGDQRYHDIADYFWHEVVSQRTYCTGGTSNGEGWQTDPGKFADQLGPAAEECCCGYNMMKLTRHVFSWTGEPAAMDYYERALFNSRLGTQDSEGMKMYYLSLYPSLWKTFGKRFDSFWCCTGTGSEEFAKFGDTIYFHDAQGVYVNLFIASELSWPEKKVTLLQETSFPEEEGTTLTIKTGAPVKMPLHARVPYWAMQGATVSINGKKQEVAAKPSS